LTYRAHATRRVDPGRLPGQAKRDAVLMAEIRRVYEANLRVCGVRKSWRQLAREGITAARCTVARLRRAINRRGVVRGKTVRTTIPDPAAACALDRVDRQFKAAHPDRLWVASFTDIATWGGIIYTALVVNVFARRIVGWRVSRSARPDFVFDAL